MNVVGLLLLGVPGILSGIVSGEGVVPGDCAAGPEWSVVIEGHVSRYPEMGAADLYKLLHQGAMGSEHAVESLEAARRWMVGEVAALGDGPSEPLVDTIAPRGAHVRIHLRPFIGHGGDAAVLLSAFVRTANAGTGSEETLVCALETTLAMAREGQLPWNEAELTRYFDDRRKEGYPAVHHSERFQSLYRPAYRVVAGDLVDEALGIAR